MGSKSIGLNEMPAGLFSTIVFLQPVLVGIFSWLWLGESMNGLKITGLIVGFLGVGIISSGGYVRAYLNCGNFTCFRLRVKLGR